MRKPFLEQLTALVEKDPRVVLIVGDVGFSYIEEFKERFPNQFLNAGIAEQNMMGMASGMAYAGWKPWVYTMTNFILLRPLEQVRNDICYPNRNVKLIGVKGGPSYKFLGMSHNMTDLETNGILDNLPNLNTYTPATETDVKWSMEHEYNRVGPAYFQI